MTRKILIAVAVLGLFAVLMSILNAAVFNQALSPNKQSLYDLATNTLMFHTVALFAMTFMSRHLSRSNIKVVFYFFSLGTVVFSGALYLMATEEVTHIVLGLLNPVALIGGLSLVTGWIVVLYMGFTYKHKKRSSHNNNNNRN